MGVKRMVDLFISILIGVGILICLFLGITLLLVGIYSVFVVIRTIQKDVKKGK